ncbi:MAG: hypothetical protein ACU85E_08255 [Gammaproteobacteria bacterium]
MFEVAGLFFIMLLIAGSAFLPFEFSQISKKERNQVITTAKKMHVEENIKIPEEAVLSRHCLTNLQVEIESSFAPRPTDSILQRHHDTLIAFELEKRLAELQLAA